MHIRIHDTMSQTHTQRRFLHESLLLALATALVKQPRRWGNGHNAYLSCCRVTVEENCRRNIFQSWIRTKEVSPSKLPVSTPGQNLGPHTFEFRNSTPIPAQAWAVSLGHNIRRLSYCFRRLRSFSYARSCPTCSSIFSGGQRVTALSSGST